MTITAELISKVARKFEHTHGLTQKKRREIAASEFRRCNPGEGYPTPNELDYMIREAKKLIKDSKLKGKTSPPKKNEQRMIFWPRHMIIGATVNENEMLRHHPDP